MGRQYIPRQLPQPYLSAACDIDDVAPGFLNRVLRAPNLRRTVVLAAIHFFCHRGSSKGEFVDKLKAKQITDFDVKSDGARISHALLSLPERDIVEFLFGSVPDGFMGLLARLGGQPLSNPADYRLAFNLFADPANVARAKLLRQIPGLISPIKIAAAARLDPVFLHPAVLARMSTMEHVTALNSAVALIRSVVPDATDDALRQSLNDLSSTGPGMSAWVGRWLRRMTRLPFTLPIPKDDPDLRVVDGASMPELGRRLHNCAADRVGYIALGARAYLEWVGAGAPLVVELRALSEQRWVVEDIRGPHNAEPDPEVSGSVCAKLAACGVLTYRGAGSGPAAGKLRHLLGVWDIEHVEADSSLDALLNEAG